MEPQMIRLIQSVYTVFLHPYYYSIAGKMLGANADDLSDSTGDTSGVSRKDLTTLAKCQHDSLVDNNAL
jgi:hypothetical protein